MFLSCLKVRIKTWSLTRLRLVVFHRFKILPVYDDGQSISARLLLQSLGLNTCGLQHPSMNIGLKGGVPMSYSIYSSDQNKEYGIKNFIYISLILASFRSECFSDRHILYLLFSLLQNIDFICPQSQLATHYQYHILISFLFI